MDVFFKTVIAVFIYSVQKVCPWRKREASDLRKFFFRLTTLIAMEVCNLFMISAQVLPIVPKV